METAILDIHPGSLVELLGLSCVIRSSSRSMANIHLLQAPELVGLCQLYVKGTMRDFDMMSRDILSF